MRRPDGDRSQPATSWNTEDYQQYFMKSGVGLVLRAPERVALGKMTVTASGPTSTRVSRRATLRTAASFTRLGDSSQVVSGRSTFSVDTHGKKYRYYMVWLKLPVDGGPGADQRGDG